MNEAKELKQYQKQSGARIEEIAHSIGVTTRTVYNWINGNVTRIHPLSLHQLKLFLKKTKGTGQ
jgi:transposase